MRVIWCFLSLAIIRLTMELIMRECAPFWSGYDVMQKTMTMSLIGIFTVVEARIIILAVSFMREGSAIRIRS